MPKKIEDEEKKEIKDQKYYNIDKLDYKEQLKQQFIDFYYEIQDNKKVNDKLPSKQIVTEIWNTKLKK